MDELRDQHGRRAARLDEPTPTSDAVERVAVLNDIAVMMSEFVDNWPQPKCIDTALTLVAKTMRAALAEPEVCRCSEEVRTNRIALRMGAKFTAIASMPDTSRDAGEKVTAKRLERKNSALNQIMMLTLVRDGDGEGDLIRTIRRIRSLAESALPLTQTKKD